MSIQPADIKLLASERMTDTADGGGRRTNNVIPDGVPGNIFPKVSRLDSVYGRVNARKVYGQVDSANSDTYAGAHAAILDAADNDKIHVNIFTTGSEFDTRTEARDRIESYVVAGPQSRMVMYGRQLVGQQAFTVVQRLEELVAEVGDVYSLSNESTGSITAQQYVRVEDVANEVRTFSDSNGDYQRRVVTMRISSPLRFEFVGVEVPARISEVVKTAVVRETSVADVAKYYGIKPVTGGVLADALEISVTSVFSPIVPTASREVPVSNAEIAGAATVQPVATAQIPPRQVGAGFPNGTFQRKTQTINLGTAIAPGSLTVSMGVEGGSGNDANGATTDDGAGNIPESVTTTALHVFGGTVDYISGVLTVDASWSPGGTGVGGSVFVRYIPAVDLSQPAHLYEVPITLATRGTVQVVSLLPLPARGTVFVDYRALGRWYRLRDDGTGAIKGASPAYGTGTVDPVTGAVVVTLGALPDVGSSVIFGWASPAHYSIRAGATSDADSKVTQTLQIQEIMFAGGGSIGSGGGGGGGGGVGSIAQWAPMVPATLALAFVSGGVTYNVTENGSGVLSGGGVTGTVNHTTGEVRLEYGTRLPDPGSEIIANYSLATPAGADDTVSHGAPSIVGAGKTFGLPVPMTPTSFWAQIPVSVPAFGPVGPSLMVLNIGADGNGNLITAASSQPTTNGGVNWSHAGGDVIGSIDLDTGTATLLDGNVVTITRAFYAFETGGWSPAADYAVPIADGSMRWQVSLDNAANVTPADALHFSLTDYPLALDITKTSTAAIVPGSLYFALTGKRYFDRNGIVYNTQLPDGSGTQAGTVNYATGVVSLTDYVGGAALGISVLGCLTRFGDFTSVAAAFRTAGSPLRSASTFVQVTAVDGAVLTATTDQDGDLLGDFVRGRVNQQFGVVHIEWGTMVAAAGNEGAPWFDPDNVVGSQVWKPREVLPGTLRYSTVVQTSLPLDANIIQLDPVRLPSDGRVPIYRAGDVVLIHNTKVTVLANPVAAGQTYSAGRADLASLVLLDSTGAVVPAGAYVTNLVDGTVTMAADMNLGALVQPLKARHRIEELNLATDVQIDGKIALASPLTRDFDGDTFVSGALLFGDLFSRVSSVFDEVSFVGWSDTRVGSNATAEYNTVLFPIEVKNDGAVTERWRAQMTGATTFQIIGENLGVIVTNGSTAADCAPVNPLTNKPYFAIRAGGWGAGWSVGNQLRFNTFGATAAIWMVRTVLPGAALTGDSIDIQVRGDVDA